MFMGRHGRDGKINKPKNPQPHGESSSPGPKRADCTHGNKDAARNEQHRRDQNVAPAKGTGTQSPDQYERSPIAPTNAQNPGEQPPPAKTTARKHKAWRDCCALKIDAWAAFASTLSCIAAGVALWFVYGQLTAMRDQLDLMKTDSLLDSRPWVGETGTTVDSIVAGQPNRIQIKFTNTGKTPAFKFRVRNRIDALPVDCNIAVVAKPYEDEKAYPPTSLSPLPPGGICGPELVPDKSLPDLTLKETANGDKRLYVFGIARYNDHTGKLHATRYCYFLDRTSGRWKVHNQYSGMD